MQKKAAEKAKEAIGAVSNALQEIVDTVNEKMTAENIKKGIDNAGTALQNAVDKCEQRINVYKNEKVTLPYAIGTKFKKVGSEIVYEIKEYVVKENNEIFVVLHNCLRDTNTKRLSMKELSERYELYVEEETTESFFENDEEDDEE